MASSLDNFSDSASSLELLERARNEFNKERRIVIKNLPLSVTVEEVRAFVDDFSVQNVVLNSPGKQAIVTLTDSSDTQKMITSLDGTNLLYVPVTLSVYFTETLLCIANLPPTITEWKFREFVAEHGAIEKCFLMRSLESGESKGYGFVEYAEALDKCNLIRLKIDWMKLEGRILHCDYMSDKNLEFQKLQSRCLLIHNLPRDYKDVMELRQLFSSLVSPVYCQIVMKEGESLGFGIIEYSDALDAEKTLLQLKGHKIKGTEVDLSYSLPGKSAVYMFNRLMVKYGDTVTTNKPSLLPDPVYPNPALVKHPLFKCLSALRSSILADFKEHLLRLQQGYLHQLESKTNSKPGLLGPAPSIPMSPLMDVGLQLGLLCLVALHMREEKMITGALPSPLNTLTVSGPQSGMSQNGKPSLLGDPMSAQANIVLANVLSSKEDIETLKETPSDSVCLLGRPIKSLNIGYLANLGQIVGALSEQNQSMGILGRAPPRSLLDGLKPASSTPVARPESKDGLLGNAPTNLTAAKTNFMNTVKSLALQKLTETHGNEPQFMKALFGRGKPIHGGEEDSAVGGGMAKHGNSLLGKPPSLLDTPVSSAYSGRGASDYGESYRGYGAGSYGKEAFDGGYGSGTAGYAGNGGRDGGMYGGRGFAGGGGGLLDTPAPKRTLGGAGNGRGRGTKPAEYSYEGYDDSGYQSSDGYSHYGAGQYSGDYNDQYSAYYGQQYKNLDGGGESRLKHEGVQMSPRNLSQAKVPRSKGYDYGSQGNGYGSQGSNYGSQGSEQSGRHSYSQEKPSLMGKAPPGYAANDYSSSGYYSGGGSGESTPASRLSLVNSSTGSGDGKKTDYQTLAQQAAAYVASGYGQYSNYMGGYQGGYNATSGAGSGGYGTGHSAYSGSSPGAGLMPPPPPLPPAHPSSTPPSLLSTPQGLKRNSNHLLPSPEPSPEGDYIGQHSQGIGGHYADTYAKRQKLQSRF